MVSSILRRLLSPTYHFFTDPYVKIEQIHEHRRVRKRKTTIKRANLNPVYHETLEFQIEEQDIDRTNLLVKVMDWDRCIGRRCYDKRKDLSESAPTTFLVVAYWAATRQQQKAEISGANASPHCARRALRIWRRTLEQCRWAVHLWLTYLEPLQLGEEHGSAIVKSVRR